MPVNINYGLIGSIAGKFLWPASFRRFYILPDPNKHLDQFLGGRSRGTVLSVKLGISKASSELGHSDIRTTKRFYDHSEVSDDEFQSTLDNGSKVERI